MVQHTPDIYLDELQDLLERRRGVIASLSCIWTALKRSGYSMKKVCLSSIFLSTNFTISMTQLTRDAIERSEGKRAKFHYNYGLRFTAEQTVFVDESSFDHRTSLHT